LGAVQEWFLGFRNGLCGVFFQLYAFADLTGLAWLNSKHESHARIVKSSSRLSVDGIPIPAGR
jgi:hypothetical protein